MDSTPMSLSRESLILDMLLTIGSTLMLLELSIENYKIVCFKISKGRVLQE